MRLYEKIRSQAKYSSKLCSNKEQDLSKGESRFVGVEFGYVTVEGATNSGSLADRSVGRRTMYVQHFQKSTDEIAATNGETEICCSNDEAALTKGRLLSKNILENGGEVCLERGPVLLPSWYDHQLMCKGQEYFKDNLFNMFVAALSGLTALLAVPTILSVLTNTNKSSTPASAYKRYYETLVHMISWYESDLRNPNSKGRQSIAVVRKMHDHAAKTAGSITQRDLALTQFGFIGIAIVSRDKLGLSTDMKPLIHFWKVIGHLIGIQDKFNLFSGCERCTSVACQELARQTFKPGIDDPPENFRAMCSALLVGMWPIVPTMNPKAFFEFTRRLLNCPPKQLDFLATISLNMQIFVHNLLKLPIISVILLPCLNFQMWLTIFVQNTMPILAFYAYRYTWRHEY